MIVIHSPKKAIKKNKNKNEETAANLCVNDSKLENTTPQLQQRKDSNVKCFDFHQGYRGEHSIFYSMN